MLAAKMAALQGEFTVISLLLRRPGMTALQWRDSLRGDPSVLLQLFFENDAQWLSRVNARV
jgi:hypothetical protein